MAIKRIFDEITSFENLLQAEQKCASRNTTKWEVLNFRSDLEANLFEMRNRLRNLDMPPVKYGSFLVFDPKVRKIIFTDYQTKIIQRAIYEVLLEPICKGFITDTYACVPERGQHAAVERLASWFRDYNAGGIHAYYYKFDVKKFFYRIHHDVLMDIVNKKISDKYAVEMLRYYICSTQRPFGMPLYADPLTIKDEEMLWDRGIATGGGLSHLLGNMYLDPFDQYAKRERRIKRYIRFADDIIIVDTDKERLKEHAWYMNKFLEDRLLLKFNDRCALRPCSCGCEFVGCMVYPDHVLLRKSTTLRMKKKLHRAAEQYRDYKVDFHYCSQLVASYNGMLKHVDGDKYKEKLWEDFVLTHNKE